MSRFRFEPTITELRKAQKWSNIKQTMQLSKYRIPKEEVHIWKENGWKLSDDYKIMTKGKQIVKVKG